MERLQVEYKVGLTQDVLDGLDTDIASFANTEGGEIWFGVNNKGETIGAELTDVERQRISQRAAQCRPPVRIDFEELQREGKVITIILITESTSIHTDTRHRVPIRTGGITSYLDVTGVLLLARDRGLEWSVGHPQLGIFQAPPKAQREKLPPPMSAHFLASLNSPKEDVRIEMIKELDRWIYKYRLETDEKIMKSLVEGAVAISSTQKVRPFDLLRYLLAQASDDDRRRWVSLVREKALAVYKNRSVAFTLSEAMNFLSEFPDIGDLEIIAAAVTSWPKELYVQARPLSWLEGLKKEGHWLAVQQKLMGLLEEAADVETGERVKELLDYLRRA